MVYYNSKEIEINYLYLEFPKKEYYLVSNLDDEHSFEYIKPIGQDLEEGLFYEFSELVKNGYRIGKCKSCGKYFLITTKRNMEYCKTKNTNGQTCAQNVAKARFKESMQDVYLNKYDKKLATVYQNHYRAKDLEEEELTGSELTYVEYADWRDEAVQLRKKYISERDRISKDYTMTPQKKYRDKKELGEEFLIDLYTIPLPHRSGRKEHGIKIKEKGRM